MSKTTGADKTDTADQAAPATAEKPKRRTATGPRGMNIARGENGLFDTAGRALLDAIVRGERMKRAPRPLSWIGRQIGASRKLMSEVRSGKGRLNLVQARALEALFPTIPVESWLTKAEAAMIFHAQATGQRIAAEPPPALKLKRGEADPRQVTLEDVIAAKKPPPAAAEAAPASLADEPDLPDWLEPPAAPASAEASA